MLQYIEGIVFYTSKTHYIVLLIELTVLVDMNVSYNKHIQCIYLQDNNGYLS